MDRSRASRRAVASVAVTDVDATGEANSGPASSGPQMPLLPDYDGACTANVVPELIRVMMGHPGASWVPSSLVNAKQIVLLVLDGLGWNQLQEHAAFAPTLLAFEGGAITTVAPTTTSAGLTSIVTGKPPSTHGIVGMRLRAGDDTLSVLKWHTADGDARETISPLEFQTQPAFAANEVPAVTERRFIGTGFTAAHLQGARVVGYGVPSSLPVDIWRLAKAGEQFIYAYYGGIDTVAHQHGFGEYYNAELYTVDRLVRDITAGLPSGCALVITADHGQVVVGGRLLDLPSHITDLCTGYSGESRFRWLHAKPEATDELVDCCLEEYEGVAWVKTCDELSEARWFGGELDERVRSRLGDVALVASAPVGFRDPSHDGEHHMVCRHGSMTADEVLVPFIAQVV